MKVQKGTFLGKDHLIFKGGRGDGRLVSAKILSPPPLIHTVDMFFTNTAVKSLRMREFWRTWIISSMVQELSLNSL